MFICITFCEKQNCTQGYICNVALSSELCEHFQFPMFNIFSEICSNLFFNIVTWISLFLHHNHSVNSPPLQWRHNERDGVTNHQPRDSLLNRLFKVQIKVNIKAPSHWSLSGEFTGDFPAQKASNAENASIWWRHYAYQCVWLSKAKRDLSRSDNYTCLFYQTIAHVHLWKSPLLNWGISVCFFRF